MRTSKIMSIIVLALALTLITISCKKEVIEPNPVLTEQVLSHEEKVQQVYELLQSSEHEELQRVTLDELREKIPKHTLRGGECYNITDIVAFLSEYGIKTLDYIPTWNNYFQDANCNVAQWQYFGHERDPETGQGVLSPIISDSIRWNVSGAEITTFEDDGSSNQNTGNLWFQTYTQNKQGEIVPNCGFFQPPCNGGHNAIVTVYVGRATYAREAAGWAQVNNVPEEFPYCAPFGTGYSEPSSTFDWADCSCPFVFEEFEFLVDNGLDYDLNGNNQVDIADLLIILSGYGDC